MRTMPTPVGAPPADVSGALHVCPGYIEIAGEKHPCDQQAVLPPGSPPRYCPDHGVRLTPPRTQLLPPLPWPRIWRRLDERVRVASIAAVVAATGVVLDLTTQPWWFPLVYLVAAPWTVVAAYRVTRWWLTRKAIARQQINPADEVAGQRHKRRVAKRARHVAYLAAFAVTWIGLADLLGLNPATRRGVTMWVLLIVATVIGSRPYLRWVDSSRAAKPVEPASAAPAASGPDPEIEKILQDWEKLIAHDHGPLPKSQLVDVKKTSNGWEATIIAGKKAGFSPGKAFTSTDTINLIAAAYDVKDHNIVINPSAVNTNEAKLSVIEQSSLQQVRYWAGKGIDLSTGQAEVGTFDNGERAHHTFWKPGWGPTMELISGCTGSGKSEYVNLLLAMERQSGVCVSWVGDPQMGQSLGDICEGIDWFAPTIDEIRLMLQTAVRVMYARSALLIQRRKVEVRPDGEVVKRRIKYMDICEEFPLLSITIDEAHIPLQDDEVLACIGTLAKAGRKVNIKLRLVTQSPILSELRDSAMRQQLASGQVVVFRTANRRGGSADLVWPGPLPGDPSMFPVSWPDGSTTAGLGYISGQLPAPMRADYVGDVYDLFHSGPTKSLEPEVWDAAGAAYRDRRKRLEEFNSMPVGNILGTSQKVAETQEKVSGRDAVLGFLVQRWRSGNRSPVKFREVTEKVTVVSVRALTDVLNKLVEDGTLRKEGRGLYVFTEKGLEELDL